MPAPTTSDRLNRAERSIATAYPPGFICVVLLPPAGGLIVQPYKFPVCDYGCVFVRSVLGADGRWVPLDHVEVLTPWEGA